MKKVVFFAFISLFVQSASAQKNDFVLHKYDLSSIWLHTDNACVLGFIGNDYQRLRVKFLNVQRDKNNTGVYNIDGKTKVKDNICPFTGSVHIESISTDIIEYENENGKIAKQKIYVLKGEYSFKENANCSNSGLFKGKFKSTFYIDRNSKVHYDDIEMGTSDGFANNAFQGEWISNKTKQSKKCNWGDHRIPESNDLDIGAGEFSPDDKYLKNGWQTYRDAYVNNDPKAKKIEELEWWK